uniref:Uncharacterized protein n=1 Tax=Glossina pallidipes TaxID=7398 RepID=A0A1A9ZBE3_GLOPL
MIIDDNISGMVPQIANNGNDSSQTYISSSGCEDAASITITNAQIHISANRSTNYTIDVALTNVLRYFYMLSHGSSLGLTFSNFTNIISQWKIAKDMYLDNSCHFPIIFEIEDNPIQRINGFISLLNMIGTADRIRTGLTTACLYVFSVCFSSLGFPFHGCLITTILQANTFRDDSERYEFVGSVVHGDFLAFASAVSLQYCL